MGENNEQHTADLLALHKRLANDVAMLRAAFVRDALASGRHTHNSLATLLEETGRLFDYYTGSSTEKLVASLRQRDDGSGARGKPNGDANE